MKNVDLIKFKYERMEDDELIRYTETSWYLLNTNAISALYKEFIKRKLDITIFPYLRARNYQNVNSTLSRFHKNKLEQYLIYLKNCCLKDLSEGKSLDDTMKKLRRKRLQKKDFLKVIQALEESIKEIKSSYNKKVLTGVGFVLLGILMFAIWFLTSEMNHIILLGGIFMMIGVYKFISGVRFKNKNMPVFKIITSENYLEFQKNKSFRI
jgi:hypothetical protein